MNPPNTHGGGSASDWVRRWTHLLPAGCSVLDVACGGGRHLNWFAHHGHRVLGVDRNLPSPDTLAPGIQLLEADLESAPWPLMQAGRPQTFGAVVVTNYLWRPLMPLLLDSVAAGGYLIYETFSAGNETVGRPARPDFLLQPGELLRVCEGLQVVAYECGFLENPDRFLQRIVACKNALPDLTYAPPLRHAL
jgi:SAM-dependent methyltransferase